MGIRTRDWNITKERQMPMTFSNRPAQLGSRRGPTCKKGKQFRFSKQGAIMGGEDMSVL
jgi:hypothetical protein